jgi:hypothetical protein
LHPGESFAAVQDQDPFSGQEAERGVAIIIVVDASVRRIVSIVRRQHLQDNLRGADRRTCTVKNEAPTVATKTKSKKPVVKPAALKETEKK